MPAKTPSRCRDVNRERRALLLLGAGMWLPCPGGAAPLAPFETIELSVPDAPPRLGRALVILPRSRKPTDALPVLLLLHGLGETKSPRLGLRAWLEPYGLGAAWERLLTGNVRRESLEYLSDQELDELNHSLAARPFSGFCIVCPFLPNPYAMGAAAPALDRYARWLAEGLLPAVRAQLPEVTKASAHTGIAGVSLGGYAALEAALRHADLYKTVGTIQGAFSAAGARGYAERLSALDKGRRIWISTSTFDPYRKANETLAKELDGRGVAATLRVRKGPHTQGWLREIGTLDMLLWHDRVLREG